MIIIAWTEDRVDRLKVLLDQGLSAKQIANEMGGLTRNAVLGKINRLGLSRPRAPKCSIGASRRPRARRNRAAIVSGIKAARARAKVLDELLAMESTVLAPEPIARPPVALLELKDEHCRWPISDDADNTIGFCGAPRLDNTSYCAGHCLKAFARCSPTISDAERERRRHLGKSQVASGAWTCGFSSRGEV